MNYPPPPNPQTYYETVWDLAHQIPYGKVATYGQLAQMLPPPQGITSENYKVFSLRWVGNAMAVPWQRVINSQGKISKRFDAERQRLMLEEEGLLFAGDGIDLKLNQWVSPDLNGVSKQETLF